VFFRELREFLKRVYNVDYIGILGPYSVWNSTECGTSGGKRIILRKGSQRRTKFFAHKNNFGSTTHRGVLGLFYRGNLAHKGCVVLFTKREKHLLVGVTLQQKQGFETFLHHRGRKCAGFYKKMVSCGTASR